MSFRSFSSIDDRQMSVLGASLLAVLVGLASAQSAFRFSNTHGDHMVRVRWWFKFDIIQFELELFYRSQVCL